MSIVEEHKLLKEHIKEHIMEHIMELKLEHIMELMLEHIMEQVDIIMVKVLNLINYMLRLL